MGLFDKHIHQQGFTMVQMANNCYLFHDKKILREHSYISNKFWVLHYKLHKFIVKSGFWKSLFSHIKVFGSFNSDYWLVDGLGIFFLDHGFNAGIHFICVRIIFFVFVKNNLVLLDILLKLRDR